MARIADPSTNSLTPEKKAEFLSHLSECGNVTKAAELAELSRCYLYQRKRSDEQFSADWEEAARIGALRLEDEARRRAVDGWEEPVWNRGEMCGTVRKYSDTLLIVLLKAHHKDKYGDKVRQELTGPDGGPVQVENKISVIQSIMGEIDGTTAHVTTQLPE